MIAESSTNGIKPSAPMKRSIFNKPSWSNPQPIGDTDDFFHRSNQSYVEIAAEAERKRKRKLARKQREQTQDEHISGRAGKRRRVSDDSDDDGNCSSSEEDPSQIGKEANLKSPEDASDSKAHLLNPTEPKAHLSNRTEPKAHLSNSTEPKTLLKSLIQHYEENMAAYMPTAEQTALPSNIIDLEQESKDPNAQDNFDNCQISAAKLSQPLEEDEFTASDEEFPELARKARDKARTKNLESDIACANLDPLIMPGTRGSLRQSLCILQPTPPPDAVIQILITSQIDNTDPLIVNRRVSQRLKDVRLAWCQRQGFAPDFIPTVFLTWRGKRVFDVTTCKSLGIAVDQDGNILLKGQKDIMGEEDRQIHMEAMTDEILEEYKRAKGSMIIDEKEEHGDILAAAATKAPCVEQGKESQVKIILKAKGFEDYKLIVKPVSCAANPFHNMYKLAKFK